MQQPEVSIALDRLEDLFMEPAFEPFAGKFTRRTGIAQLMDAIEDLGLRRYNGQIRIIIQAPGGGDAGKVRVAIRGYCDERLARDAWELRMLRRAGHHALRIGFILLALCLLISATITAMTFLPEFVRRVLGESIGIAGWVVLWRPIELLVFEPWPIRRDVRIHEMLRNAEVEVVATGVAATTVR